MADPFNEKTPALRVSQLDASELDNEVVHIIKAQLNKLFKYHKSNVLVTYDPEVTAVIKTIIWRFTIYAHESTIGQQILNLKYSGTAQQTSWMSRRQKILYGLILIVCPWLRERTDNLLNFVGLSQYHRKIQRILKWLDISLKLAAVLNFLVFLQNGVYQTIAERILGIQAMFPNRQGVRQVSFEYMTRELLWHGFSEFLFFTLPLINFQRVKNFVRSHILRRPDDPAGDGLRVMECAVCEDVPTNPQEIGCPHLFCYYCVQSNYKADPNFSCPRCRTNIPVVASIRPYRAVIS
ncbi:peroxisome biogenesis factor 2-like [Ostrea edulis]|uniref:peroxisome biogenesis factor 2-like n=1 Tax=Ostrea edulis TaxID=37623 RepID=UPI002094A181|nr:peroxisome biogenesis factor 2-like [Ostrea edulis]